jgi:hypothetical protein
VDVSQVVQVVETALVAGAAVSVKEQASAAVTGAVKSFRDVMGRVFRDDPEASTAIQKLEGVAPEAQVWRGLLGQRLAALPEVDLRELVTQAQAVLGQTDPAGSAQGRYAVNLDLREAKGVQVNQGGSGNTQTNTFS